MKKKILGLLSLGILVLLTLISFVSAATLAEWPLTSNDQTINVNTNIDAGSFFTSSGVNFTSFNATNGATATNWSSTLDTSKYYEVTISPKTGYLIGLSDINFAYSSSNDTTLTSFSLQYSKNSNFTSPTTIVTKDDVNTTEKTYSNTALNIEIREGETLYIRWFGYNVDNANEEFRIKNLNLGGEAIKSFCKTGPKNDSDLRLDVKIKNRGKGDENKWLPLDIIEVEVKFRNDKEDLDNVIFELGLYKEGSSTNIIDDMIWISDDEEKIEVGDIDEGESKTHVFKFIIDPSEVDKENYILMIKAYPEGEETETCLDYSDDLSDTNFGSSKFYAEIEIERESDRDKMVIVDTESLPLLLETLCGEEITLTVDIYNIGDRDFQDQIMVSLYNKELGIDLKEVIIGDLDEGDKTRVTFTFRIPSDAEEKTYTLYMRTYYDYDEDDDEYNRMSDDVFPVQLKVTGGCIFDPKLTITANLESGGTAGQELVVKSTITNTDSKTRTFTITTSDYESWAELVKINPTSLTLGAGESKEVLLTFNVNPDVSGEQTFDIEILSEGQLIATQPASVSIEKAEFSLTGITGAVISGENWYLWAIGAFNVILVLIIIIVAVKLVRKK